LQHNVALRVEFPSDSDTFVVSGRGELHLTILLENMRREGFEMAVSRPIVITRQGENGTEEPIELVVIECGEDYSGTVINKLAAGHASHIPFRDSKLTRLLQVSGKG
jgi:GTP-binding protein